MPPLKFEMITSAVSASLRKISRPSGLRRSTLTLRLPRLAATKYGARRSVSLTGIHRAWSPKPGSSTLMTSAPISAISAAACGP
ncbi:unannotated protein [freshwater metagenome]|uniref:Unannotated protein n=1 Tax=freshwater metagenome TaxID=449393 RepID=A0A6J6S5R9_9ZZZZ